MYKSKKSGKRQTARNLGDITINDFANSAVCKNRIKKSSNNVNRVLKQLEEVVVEEEEGKSWDEKDFEGDLDLVQEENEDGTVTYVVKKSTTAMPRQQKKKSTQKQQQFFDEEKYVSKGKDYPIDIWFLISEYIQPEDIGIFAGICKASFAVVCSAKFWFSIYRRFYKSVPNLPERLQPECMHRKYGLRTSVIRSLYLMYQPFVDRLKSVHVAFSVHPDVLLKRQCVLSWYEKKKKHWIYYFKLQKNVCCLMSRNATVGGSNSKKQPDLLETLDDVFANSDENCRILQVTSSHFIAFPVVLGMTLTSVSLTLSQGFRYNRLQLGFGSGIVNFSSSYYGNVIILDPVIDLKVLDWWHPLYPTNHNSISSVLLNHQQQQELE